MKRFRVCFLLVLILTLFGYNGQVLAQENSDESMSLSVVQPVVEDKTSGLVPLDEEPPPSETVSEDELTEFISDEVDGQEKEEEVETPIVDVDLSNLDEVIDQLYPTVTELEEDIASKSAEDEHFKAYVEANLKTEVLVTRYMEWQAQLADKEELTVPDLETFLSGDVIQTEAFKSFVYKSIISDWLISQYLEAMAEDEAKRAEEDAELSKRAIETILASKPQSSEELETYFYAKLFSDEKLKSYFYSNLKSDVLISQYFNSLEDEELGDYLTPLSSEDNRRLRAYFYQTLQRDGYFRSYFYQTTAGDSEGSSGEGTRFFARIYQHQDPNLNLKRKQPKSNNQTQPYIGGGGFNPHSHGTGLTTPVQPKTHYSPPPPAPKKQPPAPYVPPTRPPYSTDSYTGGPVFQPLDTQATYHSPNGKANIPFKVLEERGVSVSDNHYKAHYQYHLDALHRQQERGLELSSYHYNSLTSIYDTMATKQNAYTSGTTSYTHTPSVSARPGVGGLTDAEMRNLEIKLLGRSYSDSNYSNSFSSSSSSASKLPGVGGFSDEDLARLERKFESLFKKTSSKPTHIPAVSTPNSPTDSWTNHNINPEPILPPSSKKDNKLTNLDIQLISGVAGLGAGVIGGPQAGLATYGAVNSGLTSIANGDSALEIAGKTALGGIAGHISGNALGALGKSGASLPVIKAAATVVETGFDTAVDVINGNKVTKETVGSAFVVNAVFNLPIGGVGKPKNGHQVTLDTLEFSDKFKRGDYKNQVFDRGWTNEMIVDTINNPIKTSSSVNKATGNTVTNYYINETHYIAVDDVTNKVIQVADLTKIWKGPN